MQQDNDGGSGNNGDRPNDEHQQNGDNDAGSACENNDRSMEGPKNAAEEDGDNQAYKRSTENAADISEAAPATSTNF